MWAPGGSWGCERRGWRLGENAEPSMLADHPLRGSDNSVAAATRVFVNGDKADAIRRERRLASSVGFRIRAFNDHLVAAT